MKKIAVVLSGCGYLDGAEITESVSTLIGLSQMGVDYTVFAPDVDIDSQNHLSHEYEGQRNIFAESARIARGKVEELEKLQPQNFDGLVLPGGYGVALHLCDFAKQGAASKVLPKMETVIRSFHSESKPIAAFCISPALVARVLGKEFQPTLTIGNDEGTAKEIEKTGAIHENCAVSDYISDRENKIISSPAYMYEAKPHEVYEGIHKALTEFVEMA